MRVQGALGWSVAGLASLALCWANGRSPPSQTDGPAPPPALPRPTSEADWQRLQEQAADLNQALTGRASLPLDAVEGALPGGLPDNPLVEGISTLAEACADAPGPQPVADWLYCPKTRQLRPGQEPGADPITSRPPH